MVTGTCFIELVLLDSRTLSHLKFGVKRQNEYLRANCMMRGATDVVVIWPNAAAFTAALAGLLNCGWLNALNISARNCKPADSTGKAIRIFLINARSQLNWPG